MPAKAKSNSEYVIVIAGKEQTLVNAKCTELIDRLIPPEERATASGRPTPTRSRQVRCSMSFERCPF